MNDNPDQPITATVIAPREEVKAMDAHQQVEALIEVWKIAEDLRTDSEDIENQDFQPLWEAASNLSLPIQDFNPKSLLTTIDACLNMALPGSPLYARGIGMFKLTFPGGKIAPAIAMELFPGKQVIMPMSRETIEDFEKLLKAAIDQHFGRIIKP